MKKNFLLLISVILIFPKSVLALGLGTLTVFSKLNEPLKAQIELTNVRSSNIDEIIVGNASKATYKRADLPKPASFRKVKFKIIKKSNGSVVVNLTGKKPLRELYITFIADLKWKDIHLNKEYTFLLDPATFSDNNKKKQSPPTRSSSSKKSSKYKKQRNVSSSSNNSSYSTKKNTGRASDTAHLIKDNSYGPVQRNDTLSHIAQRVRPDKSVTAHQTMQALFVLNPKAFINNNINLLKQGQTLIIPTSDQVRQIINDKTVAKTNQPSATGRIEQAASTKTSKAADAADAAETTPPESDNEGQSRLKIIPPIEDSSNKLVDSNEDFKLMSKTLKTSLETITLLKDTIVLLKKENVTLNSRLENLTEKLNSYDLKNNDLNNKIDRISNMLEQQKSTTSLSSNNSLSVKSTQAQESPLSLDSSMAAAKDNSTSFMQTIMMYKTYLLLFVIALMLIVIIILFKNSNNNKNHSSQNEPDEADNLVNLGTIVAEHSSDTMTNNDTEKQAGENSESDFSDYFDERINSYDARTKSIDENNSIDSKADTETRSLQEQAEDIKLDFELDTNAIDDVDIKDNEEDIMQLWKESAKAKEDVYRKIETYVAYGKYDSAEDLIQENLLNAPEDKGLNIKLFEIYSQSNQQDKFMQQMDKVSQLLNSDAEFRQTVKKMHQKAWNNML